MGTGHLIFANIKWPVPIDFTPIDLGEHHLADSAVRLTDDVHTALR